jgi:hypothetical protein
MQLIIIYENYIYIYIVQIRFPVQTGGGFNTCAQGGFAIAIGTAASAGWPLNLFD